MESTNYLQKGVKELTKEDLLLENGGGFAYDLGFFFREAVIYVGNGGNMSGISAVAIDLSVHYRPACR
jgi:hypothetical protein